MKEKIIPGIVQLNVVQNLPVDVNSQSGCDCDKGCDCYDSGPACDDDCDCDRAPDPVKPIVKTELPVVQI